MKSDPTLKRWYRVINRRFFDGQLTNRVCVRWATDEDEEDFDDRREGTYFGLAAPIEGRSPRHDYEIVLSRAKVNSLSTKLLTLAHEMCHIATGLKDDHGPAFEYWRQYISDRGIFHKHALAKNLTIF